MRRLLNTRALHQRTFFSSSFIAKSLASIPAEYGIIRSPGLCSSIQVLSFVSHLFFFLQAARDPRGM